MAGGSGQQSPVCVHVKDNPGLEEGKAELWLKGLGGAGPPLGS